MGKRKCPLCFVRVPWTAALVNSEEIHCPGCHASLELSRFTRVFSGFGGVLGAWVVDRVMLAIFPEAPWVLRVVAAILAFALVSAACALIAGDLVVRSKMITSAVFPQHGR